MTDRIFDVSLSIRRNGGAVGFYIWWEWYRPDAILRAPERTIGVVLGVFDITLSWPDPHYVPPPPLAASEREVIPVPGSDDG